MTVPYSPVWDIVRVVVAVSTALLACFYARIAFGERPVEQEEAFTIRVGIVGYLFVMLPTSLTAVDSIGEPMVPWRLPMYVLFNVFGWWYVRRRL